MADGPTQHTPIDLRDVLITGATVGGVRVVRIVCELEDGGKISRVFPQREISQEDPDMVQTEGSELTERHRAILQVIEKMKVGDVLSTEEIAKRSGYANTGGLRNYLKILQASGRLLGTSQGQQKVY